MAIGEHNAESPEPVLPAPEADLETLRAKRLYTGEEVCAHFERLLPALELPQKIEDLGCGLDGFFRKKTSLRAFTAMSIALWQLALERSFPGEAEAFFNHFLTESNLLGKGKKRERLIALIRQYCELFAEKKADDFTPVSKYMTETLGKNPGNAKVLHFKLSLTIRHLYQRIFDYLI